MVSNQQYIQYGIPGTNIPWYSNPPLKVSPTGYPNQAKVIR